ncbi:hypothetical protein HK104_000507 [Borealophlyctis nickersoniae]|nr:hypothetical protein HK104_000507 [Borealophlyctis nickersoniae]
MKKFMAKFSKDSKDSKDKENKKSNGTSPQSQLVTAHTPSPTSKSAGSLPRTPPAAGSGQFKSGFDELYFVGRQLGTGSFATVKECTRKSDSRKFAVKIVDKYHVKGKEDMLRSEIAVLKKVHHPNIVTLHDLYETDSHIYLVTDLATGGELFDQIFAKGSYTEKDASALVKQLLNALAYLHNLDIVHRDLKPENLLFKDTTETSDIMVTDFGLSKIAAGADFLRTACGTPHYVAPEILKQTGHGKPVDMWAMGVITYVLLCGYTPFWGGEDSSNAALYQAIVDCNYEFDEEYWGQISQSAKDFIKACLVVDPAARLTARQALEHPWLLTESTFDLKPNLEKNFNARRTFRKAILAVSSINRAKNASASFKNLLPTPPAEEADNKKELSEPAIHTSMPGAFPSANKTL